MGDANTNQQGANLSEARVLAQISEEAIKDRNVSLIATELVNDFIERYNVKWFVVGDADLGIYCWDGRRYYECETLIYEYLETNYTLNNLDSYKIRRGALLKEFTLALKGKSRYELSYEPLMISFNNVVLDWESLLNGAVYNAFHSHNPELVIYHHIPHNINHELVKEVFRNLTIDDSVIHNLAERYTPKTLNAFKEWVGDKWILLYEMIGCVLLPKPIKKAFLLIGDTDTGKSTYLRLQQRLIGKDNYTSISLQELTNPEYRFRASRIYRKLANYYPDLPTEAVRNPGAFKVITGEDVITIERKHRDPFEWLPYTKHFFSANEPPPVYGADRAFWNRWLVVEFEGSFKKKIKDFERMLLDEASNILAISVIAMLRVVSRDWTFSYENTPEDAKRKWLMSSDSVYAFMVNKLEEGELEEDPAGSIASSDLYNMYVEWCHENDMQPLDSRVFPNHIKKIMGYKTKKVKGKTYIVGIRKASQRTLEDAGENQ